MSRNCAGAVTNPKRLPQGRELVRHEASAPSEQNINQIHSPTSALKEIPS